jgi:hypothetical protein
MVSLQVTSLLIDLLKKTNMDKLTRKALKNVIDYLYEDELENFENLGQPSKHIYKDIRKLLNYLDNNKKQQLIVDFSESDLQDLQSGDTFDWTFTTDRGEDIDIHLKPTEYNDDGDIIG